MSETQQLLLRSYSAALLALLLATILRAFIDPALGGHHPFLTYFGAVLFVAWYSGLGPAVATLVAGTLLANYLFAHPFGSLWLSDIADWVGFGLYILTGLVVIGLAESLRVSKARIEVSEKRFRQAVDNIPDWVMLYDAERRIQFINTAGTRTSGQPAAALLGRRDEECWPPEITEVYLPALKCAMETRTRQTIETLLNLPGGTRTAVVITYVPMLDANGEIEQILVVVHDITQHKQAEQLAEVDRRKDDFLATLAHELRNPLAPISNALQLIKLSANKPATTNDALTIAERQIGQLVRLVDDLLNISRIKRGKITLHKEPVELGTVIQRALEISRPQIDAARHWLTVDIPKEPIHLEADPARLVQVVSNLLINAAKYTDPGGRICLTVRTEDKEVRIAVQDNGIGISEDMLPKVFDMFAQVEQPAGHARGGLGIGLALVKSLVELHGGSVQAASAGLGQGSTFTVRLPCCVERPVGESPADTYAKEARSPAPARRVLVVDDDIDSAESTATLLKASGHEARTAHDGRTAIETACQYRPEVVLLDIGMPGMDGYEVARHMRRQPELRGTLLIALTAWGQEEVRLRAREAGFDYHMVKPLDLETLRALLNSDPPSPAT